MSIRALPMIVIALFVYNVIAFLGGGAVADEIFRKPLFSLPMLRGSSWTFSWGDLVILLTLILLFVELLKSTNANAASMIDHGLSMLVFIICLIEFLLVDRAATSVFFFIMVAALIDVVAGHTIGVKVARRDLNIGGGDH